jgi:hypothetical protein
MRFAYCALPPLAFAKKQENTGERDWPARRIGALRFCVRGFAGTERPFASDVDFASSEFCPSGENLMKTITLLFGACAVVAVPLATAAAGPCTADIETMTKLLASRDAGSGPTAGPAGTTTGQHPPTSAMGAADSSTAASAAAAESAKPQHPPTAAMNQATQGGGASPRAGEPAREQHPPTAAMNEATQGGAASPQDVQSQTRGGPTAAQQAEGARRPASDRLASAQSALEQARRFDASGQEAQCMEAVGRARGLMQ